MITDLWHRIRTALVPAPEQSHPTYDIGYLKTECNYKHLELFVERDDARLIRCNICGHYFEPSGIEVALDHVAESHGKHTADEINAIEEANREWQVAGVDQELDFSKEAAKKARQKQRNHASDNTGATNE
jgi:hypothetical protein